MRASPIVMQESFSVRAMPGITDPLGFFDPLGFSTEGGLAAGLIPGGASEGRVKFYREAEIKHGRVAMAGVVGYIVHANDIRFPWEPFASAPTGVSPQALWDGLPEAAKWQIILTVGFFEFWRENSYILSSEGEAHYMRGGKPGYFPTFAQLPHPVPFNLFDPFGLSKNASPEKKAKGLLAEINNGRLAQILSLIHI